MDYFKAYNDRLDDVSSKIDVVANKLIKLGWKLFRNSCFPKTLRILTKDDSKIVFGFAEVPYRWYITNEYHGKIYYYITPQNAKYPDCPITVEDCLNNIQPIDDITKHLIKIDNQLNSTNNE